MKLSIHPLARNNLNEAADWYDEKSSGRGDKFVGEVNDLIMKIVEKPEHFRIVHGTIRQANLKVHPYNILFKLKGNGAIRITAIRHNKRHPSYGIRRK